MGSGKANEVRDAASASSADVILVDHALSPSQERNLEEHIGRRVLDRNSLILDIFAQRARSFEGKLEVELAQLKHIASRLVRGWTHLERQKGGIGLRGPGETQLETDRRLIGQRVRVLTKRLDRLVDDGLLKKVPYEEHPPRYEYRLTEKGRAFWDVLAAMWRWGSDWLWDGKPMPMRCHIRRPNHDSDR